MLFLEFDGKNKVLCVKRRLRTQKIHKKYAIFLMHTCCLILRSFIGNLYEIARKYLCESNKNYLIFVQNTQKVYSIYYICRNLSYKYLSFCVKKIVEKKAGQWYDIIGMVIGLGILYPFLSFSGLKCPITVLKITGALRCFYEHADPVVKKENQKL